MDILKFDEVNLRLIDKDGAMWLTAKDIAVALYGKGYTQTDTPFEKRIMKLFKRHEEEFTARMTAIIPLQTNGGIQNVRVFSLRGAHLLGMLARTDRAKEFRRWVLDVIERHQDEVGFLTTEYHQAIAAFEAGKSTASMCGSGLNKWRKDKQILQEKMNRIMTKLQPRLL